MDILITTPFHPAYMTRERLQKTEKLCLIITAGVGSDHIDLHAAADLGMTVAEITGASTIPWWKIAFAQHAQQPVQQALLDVLVPMWGWFKLSCLDPNGVAMQAFLNSTCIGKHLLVGNKAKETLHN